MRPLKSVRIQQTRLSTHSVWTMLILFAAREAMDKYNIEKVQMSDRT